MKAPLFVRPLTAPEQAALRRRLRSTDAFTLRRAPILLASHQGQRPAQTAASLGCATQTVRDALRAFAAAGLACLRPKPKTPKVIHATWPKERDDNWRALLHQSPAPAASRPACGRRRWPPRSASRRAGPPASSAARPSAWC